VRRDASVEADTDRSFLAVAKNPARNRVVRVEISLQAERDAESILEWLLSEKTGQAGIDWFLGLDDAFASLSEVPERCPLAPEASAFPLGYANSFTAGSRTFIEFSSPIPTEAVTVLHIRHGRRKPAT
jgi:plasmid stabilization system protein ParE